MFINIYIYIDRNILFIIYICKVIHIYLLIYMLKPVIFPGPSRPWSSSIRSGHVPSRDLVRRKQICAQAVRRSDCFQADTCCG